jgi:hypothetical protein
VPGVRRPAGVHQHRVQVIDRLGVSPGACLRAQEGPQVERGREVDLLVDLPAETPVKAFELDGEDGGRACDGKLLVGAHFLTAPAVGKRIVSRLDSDVLLSVGANPSCGFCPGEISVRQTGKLSFRKDPLSKIINRGVTCLRERTFWRHLLREECVLVDRTVTSRHNIGRCWTETEYHTACGCALCCGACKGKDLPNSKISRRASG